nr:MAG TPA: hypothetical protein [Caudoviricetes sp.]
MSILKKSFPKKEAKVKFSPKISCNDLLGAQSLLSN